jgi:hypothetical protein
VLVEGGGERYDALVMIHLDRGDVAESANDMEKGQENCEQSGPGSVSLGRPAASRLTDFGSVRAGGSQGDRT